MPAFPMPKPVRVAIVTGVAVFVLIVVAWVSVPPDKMGDWEDSVSRGAAKMPVNVRTPEREVTVKVPEPNALLRAVWTALTDTDKAMLAVVSTTPETVPDRVKLPGVNLSRE